MLIGLENRDDLTVVGVRSPPSPFYPLQQGSNPLRFGMPYKDPEKQKKAQREWARRNPKTIAKNREVHKKRNIERMRELKESQPCTDCGNSFPYPAMQYDHLPGTVKLGNVANMAHGNVAWKKVLEEIEKCELVCSNCHAVRTARRNGDLI